MSGSILRRGATSWRLKFTTPDAPGKAQYRTVRGSEREAQRALRKILTDIEDGRHVARSGVTVARLVRERIAQWHSAGDIAAKTQERYSELAEGQIIPHLGDTRAQDLTVSDLETWHTTLRQRGRKDGAGGISARTIKHAHRVLAKALSDAVRLQTVVKNVAGRDGQRAPKVETDEITIVDAERLPVLIERIKPYAIYCKAIIALFMGVRRGETLALRWGRLDFKTRIMKIRDSVEETKAGLRIKTTKTKNGRRDLAMPDIVVDALREHWRAQLEWRLAAGLGKPGDDDLVFPAQDGGPQRPSNLSGDWSAVARAIKMADISLHALRHTHASQLIDAGLDVVAISKRLGHASPHITLQVYAHLFKRDDRAAAEIINAALLGHSGLAIQNGPGTKT